MKPKEICIIGAGNGGSAIAGDMSLAGHHCRLFEFPEYRENIDPVIASGCIEVTGIARTGTANVHLATTDLAEAVDGAELIMVTTQALAHERTARELAPYLRDGQTVILWPGSGGTLVMRKVWGELGMDRKVVLAEAVTFPYCCRSLNGPGTVNIHRVDGPEILIAALPANKTPAAIAALQGTYATQVKAARSILEPALYNVNIIVHPVGALLNMGRIEFCGGEFYMYKEGITPSVKKVIDAMDHERSNLFEALGYKPYTYTEIFKMCFNMPFEDFAATSSKGPFNMQDRYVTEDIPMGTSLTVSLARKAGVATPTYNAIVHLASVVNDTKYYQVGRTVENLNLDAWSLVELDEYLQTGVLQTGKSPFDRIMAG
ncbi:MAG: NAD/NADP octopine/nopaline dehydrogenase family protein [Pirellulales bacterium]|nr:NAD/NADP octopine/nopaline dehydrogenase family protein [Pirellulales bacterium]